MIGSLEDVFAQIGQRHEVVRTGQRDEIPSFVRAAVWLRDGGRCRLCVAEGIVPDTRALWHLDHIIPWSAGGSDRSENLRVLCERHSMERSNYYDIAEERPQRPVTWWCINCWSPELIEQWAFTEVQGVTVPLECPIHQYGCRVLRLYRTAFEREHAYPDWFAGVPSADPGVIAFCAHCGAPGSTDHPL